MRESPPSPPWGRGWLDEAFSSAEARRGPHVLLVVGVRGFKPNVLIPSPPLATQSSAPLARINPVPKELYRWGAIGILSFHGFYPLTRPAPLVRGRVAVHPLPQRGEG